MHIVVFEKFRSAHLFQIAQAKSCDYLIIYTKNITKTTTKFDRTRVFSSFNWLAQTDYKLCQIQTFSRQRFQNHSPKNLEMCKDWFYTSLLKILTWFTIIRESKYVFRINLDYESSARSILLFWNQENASSSQRWRHVLAELFNDSVHHCLFLRPQWLAGLIEKFLRFKTRKWRREFVFFQRCHRWASGATVVVEAALIWLFLVGLFVFFFSQSETICNLHSCHRRTALLSQPIRI